jgi:Cysteine-rich CWC
MAGGSMLKNSAALNQSLCPLCGKANQCAIEIEKATGVKQAACWCVGMDFSADLLSQVPASAQGQACICAACAAKSKAAGCSNLPTSALSG